ncbi:MAG: alginate O-acetyltransferase AlgX-related protein [Pseudomarimonas sp.]
MWMRLLPALLFMAVLLLPLFAQMTGMPQVPPLEEYRKLAEWPDQDAYLTDEKADFLGYTAKLNRWHLDNFTTRAFWVRLRTQTLFTLFNESDQVHVGPDNWMFYRSVIDFETPSIERITPESRQALVAKIERLSALLDQRGIQLYVMPLALKDRYYPEFLPSSASHARQFRFYDQFMDALVANGRLRVIDSRDPLANAKRDGMKIFHQTDFHWTDPAGALVFRSLLQQLAASEGLKEFADSWRYEIVDQPMPGGERRAIPLFESPPEQSIGVTPLAPLTRYVTQTHATGVDWSSTAEPGQGPLLQPMLAFGDSYLDAGLRAGFFYLFEAVARGRLYTVSLADAYQQRPAGTRYLLLEWITSGTFAIDTEVTGLITALEAEGRDTPAP